jgi:hypothetical protein
MGKHSRLSHDQKRKAKRAQDARRARAGASPLAYSGNKYKKEAHVPLMFETELGIFEAYRMTDQALTDHDVHAALEKLILALREGELPPLDQTQEVHRMEGDAQELVQWSIRRHWVIVADKHGHYGQEDRIGVLRTLLGSIDTWGTASRQSRGYLHFLEGFMKKMGVCVTAHAEDGEVQEPEEDAMLEVGRDWCHDGDDEAARAFRDWVAQEIRAGGGQRVVDVCQQLLGEIGTREMSLVSELSALSLQAHRALKKG